ncbi:PREDICTED: sphingosine kinase 2-like [Calidris pugnax]|uniref:sphingosine kinase 2-like n=1 Tax=Calidris pugnax TaxID=198806 RepID=UPI00071D5276|nr:PREDICTED: sphingosine kinase 2-like [Calidris pugnax]
MCLVPTSPRVTPPLPVPRRLAPALGLSLLQNCAVLLCRGGPPSPLDLVSVTTASGTRVFSFLSVAWGLVADVDIESERLRRLGPARFALGTVTRLLALHTYRGRLSYLPAAPPRSATAADVTPAGDTPARDTGGDLLLPPKPLPRALSDLGLCGGTGSGPGTPEGEGGDWGDVGDNTGLGDNPGLGVTPEPGGTRDTPRLGDNLGLEDTRDKLGLGDTPGLGDNPRKKGAAAGAVSARGDTPTQCDTPGHRDVTACGDTSSSGDTWSDGDAPRDGDTPSDGATKIHGVTSTCEDTPRDGDTPSDGATKIHGVTSTPSPNGPPKAASPPPCLPGGPVDDLLVPLGQPVPPGWVTLEGDFVLVLAIYQSHLGAELVAAPRARPDDGLIHLCYVRAGVSRGALLRVLLAMTRGGSGGDGATPGPPLARVPARAFRLEPLTPRGVLTVDGERVEYGPLQGQIHRGLARLLTPPTP